MKTEKARFTVFETAWGYAGFAAGARGITGLLLPVMRRDAAMARFSKEAFDAALMKDLQTAIRLYFEGKEVDFRNWPCVDIVNMSEFSSAVLRECRKTGYGATITYGELARLVGSPKAARAVGMVLARNSVPLIVPCHRILRTGGGLGGFSGDGGIRMKRRLLKLESGQPIGRYWLTGMARTCTMSSLND